MPISNYPEDVRAEWARVIAHAWNDEGFMKQLRENPKEALEQFGASQILAHGIILPVPDQPPGLESLNESQLSEFAKEPGLMGIAPWC